MTSAKSERNINPLRKLVKQVKSIAKLTLFPELHPVIVAVKPFTMLSNDRLQSLMKLSTEIARKHVAGAFVECGTCRGGSGAILAWAAKEEGWKRSVYLFDSFQGHPSSASNNAPDRDRVTEWAGTMVASVEDVKLALRKVGAYAPDHVKIVAGWFQESIPTVDIPQIALLHLDADWYDSTLFCLEALYEKVVSGGYIVVDDYYFYEGCRLAVDRFFKERGSEIRFSGKVGAALILSRK